MAGYENIKDKGFDHRTTGELREIAKKGGRASGEARRRRADFRRTLNKLLTLPIDSPEWTPILESLGLEANLENAVNMAMVKEALLGNVKAYDAIARYSGQSTKTEADDEEQKIRTDRARQARNQEVGDEDNQDENIRNFLNAVRPTEEELTRLFREEDETDAEET